MTVKQTQVLIAGSGPTGLFAALLLNHCGITVRIIDKGTQQAHESRAFALQARSLELLQSIGLADKFLQKGLLAAGMQLYVDSKQRAELNITDINTNTPYSFILMLPQSQIEEILLAELKNRGVEVEHNTQLVTFTQEKNSVTSILTKNNTQPETFKTDYLIGADGAHSTVRTVLGFPFEGSAYPQNFMLADGEIDWPLDYTYVKIFMRGTNLGIFMPLKGKLGRLIVINPNAHKIADSAAAKNATNAEPATLEEIVSAFEAATGFPVKVTNPIWMTRYRIHHRAVTQYREGRVFLAGDAAHIHSPIGGQGMNTGLQDVANLAWKLSIACKTKNASSLLDTYNSERWPIGQKLLRYTDSLFTQISSITPFKATLRNTFMPLIVGLISKSKYCRSNAFRFLSQLGIRYHSNAFLLDDIKQPAIDIGKKVSAGHRAPNAYYKREHDIYSLLQGYQFHVLALVKKALTETEIKQIAADLATLPKKFHPHFISHSLIGENKFCLQAQSNQIYDAYGLTDNNPIGLFIIRPDGYIAYRSNQIDINSIINFCNLFAGESPK
jgi:2-polyprenyl-6-methoxyphenol hydroxylase-like FAD-dependent oxidoreductase